MYAKKTKVPVDRTRNEIEALLEKRGARRFAYMTEAGRAVVMFEAFDRKIRFTLPVPDGTNDRDAKLRRSKWRALLLCIKAKLESVESEIETFEEAFLAHVVLPDGKTAADHVVPAIERAYASGSVGFLLPPPKD